MNQKKIKKMINLRGLEIQKASRKYIRLYENDRRTENSFSDRNRRLLEVAAIIPFEINPEKGQLIFVGPQSKQMLGYTPEQMLNKDFWNKCIHPEDFEKVVLFCSGKHSDHDSFVFDFRIFSAEGRIVWLHAIVTVEREGELPILLSGYLVEITELKRVQEKLRESEEQLRATFEMEGVGKAQVDLQTGRLFRVNSKFCEITGYTSEELSKMHCLQLKHPDDRSADEVILQKVKQGKLSNYCAEKRYVRKDGNIVWVRITLNVICDALGKPDRTVAVIQDISVQKRMEEELKKAKNLAESITNTAKAVIIGLDQDGKIVFFNRQSEELTGWNQSEAIGKDWFSNFLPERFRPTKETQFPELIDKLGGIHNIRPILTKSGEERLISWDNSTLKNDDGTVSIVLGTGIDITEREKTESRLKRYKEDLEMRVKERTLELSQINSFLDSLVENIPNMIFVKDADSLRFVRINKAGEDLLGYSREDLLGKSDYDFFHKAEADFFTSKDRAVLAEGKLLDIPEEPIQTKNGKRFLHTKKIPVSDERGIPRYLLGISEDITEKKIAEESRLQLKREQLAREEAEKAIRLRDDFIAVASHELKTPLTALKMQIQIIPKVLRDVSFSGKDHFYSLLQNSLRQLDQFLDLVDNLLDMSRINAGRMVLQLQPVMLSDVVQKTVEQYKLELKLADCKLEMKLTQNIQGLWDPIRIEQIVVNLLTNAMKYGAHNPIEVTTEVEGRWARLKVQDHGIGIAKEDQKKIFERFERATPVTKYRGLGLGLYIVHQIVQAHCGVIRVESESGLGSTFIVELPCQT